MRKEGEEERGKLKWKIMVGEVESMVEEGDEKGSKEEE